MKILLSISDTLQSVGGLTGNYPDELFGWCLFFAIIGFVFTMSIHAATRDVHKPGTPVKFSIVVWLQKNWPRIVMLTIAMYAVIRFYPEFYGEPLTEKGAFIAGAGLDGSIIFIRKLIKARNKR